MVISEDEEDEHQDVARFLSPGGSGGVDGGGQSTGSVSPNSPFAVIVPVPAPRRKRVSVTSSASPLSSASEPERGRVGSGQAGAVTAGTLRTGPSSPMDVSMRSFRAALPRAGTSSSTSGGSLGQSRGGQTMSIVAHSDSAGSRDAVTIPWYV